MKNMKFNVGSFAQAKNAEGFFSTKLQAKMRSILAIIALVAVIGFSMAACGGGGDDDNNNNNNNNNNNGTVTAASLYGTWEKISSTDTYWNTIAFGK